MTAEVARCGSRSFQGSRHSLFPPPFPPELLLPLLLWGVAGPPPAELNVVPPTLSYAILLLSGLPSNTLTLWQPLCQSCDLRGVASYLQSPGRVNCEWGSTSVISEDSSRHGRRAPSAAAESAGEVR